MKSLLFSTLIILLAMTASAQPNTSTTIKFEDAYSVYITSELKKSKELYTKWLDFEVIFEASWFVYMQSRGNQNISFALIDEDHPSTPPAYGTFNGRGSFLTLQVADAEAVYAHLTDRGAPITYGLSREDWGQLRFGLTDPNGLYIDIVQQIEPKPGYWEQYLPKHD